MSGNSTGAAAGADDVDTACERCRSTADDGMLLCDLCDRGYHIACLKPPLAQEPEGDWYCPLCEKLRKTDECYKSVARVRVFWPAYDDHFVGYVIGVRAATDEELEEAEASRGAPIYHIYYNGDDVQWEFLKPSDFLRADEAATALQRGADRRLGKRVQVEHKQSASAKGGWYSGVVSDVRVERLQRYADQILYLVRYDDGDVHWHDLAAEKWMFEDDAKKVAKAAHRVNGGGQLALVKRPRAEVEAEAAAAAAERENAKSARKAEAARELLATLEEEEEKDKAFHGKACERLERALLVGALPPSNPPATLAIPAAEFDEIRQVCDLPISPPFPGFLSLSAAEFDDIRQSLEASRGNALAAQLRSLTHRTVDDEGVLKKGGAGHGVAKLVGKLERLVKPEAVAMAADATEAVRAAAKAVAVAWSTQIAQAMRKAGEAATSTGGGTAAAPLEVDSKAWVAPERAQAIVACLVATIAADAARKSKVRALVTNLSEPTNAALRHRVLAGEVSATELVTMSHEQLAAPEVQLQRQASREASKRAVTILGHVDQPFGEAKSETPSSSRKAATPADEATEGEAAGAAVGRILSASSEGTSGGHTAVGANGDEVLVTSDDELQVVGEVTREERDAKARAEAVVIDCDSSEEEG